MDDDDGDGRRHFNFKQIVKDETTVAGKKKKWKKKRKPTEEKAPVADDFQVGGSRSLARTRSVFDWYPMRVPELGGSGGQVPEQGGMCYVNRGDAGCKC